MPDLTVNGEVRSFDLLPGTVLALIEALGVKPQTVAAEVNGAIVPREEYASATLAPDDKIELVRFLGGG